MALLILFLAKTQNHVTKSPSGFLAFFPKRSGIFSPNFTLLLYIPIYASLQITVQLLATLKSYAILSATIHFMLYAQNVHHRPKCTLALSEISPSSWEFLVHILHAYYTFLSMLK